MSLLGGLPAFNGLWEATVGRFSRLTATVSAALPSGATVGGVQIGVPTVRTDAGAATTPDITDHGKTIRLTNATPVVNLPAISAVFEGYEITLVNVSGGNDATVNRNGTDTIDPGATTFKFQSANGFNIVRLRVVGGVWMTTTRRFRSADTALSTSNTAGSFTHNLGVKPIILTVHMINTTIDVSYEVGDVIAGNMFSDTGGTAAPVMIATGADASAITYQYNGAGLGRGLPTEGTGALAGATLGSWAFYVVAEYPSGL